MLLWHFEDYSWVEIILKDGLRTLLCNLRGKLIIHNLSVVCIVLVESYLILWLKYIWLYFLLALLSCVEHLFVVIRLWYNFLTTLLKERLKLSLFPLPKCFNVWILTSSLFGFVCSSWYISYLLWCLLVSCILLLEEIHLRLCSVNVEQWWLFCYL